MSRINNILAYLTAALALTSCAAYTGVDTTAKITAKDVKRQHVTVTPEQSFLAGIEPVAPRRWQPGMVFTVTDPRIAVIFDPASTSSDTLRTGDRLLLQSARPVNSFSGEEVVELRFVDAHNGSLIYRPTISYTQFVESNRLEVPFAVQQCLIDSVAARMVGKEFYVLPQRRLDENLQPVNGRRYQPVTITGVTVGNAVQPLTVWFTDENGQKRALLMTVASTSGATRNFESLFAVMPPRKRYPNISDETWELITQSRLALGMTPEECRLALGAPDNVLRVPTTMGMGERWTYDNGVYLIFEDGALARFRQ